MDCRKAALDQNIREHRSKLDQTLGVLDQRLAIMSTMPAKIAVAATFGRNIARLLTVATIAGAFAFLIADLLRSTRRRNSTN